MAKKLIIVADSSRAQILKANGRKIHCVVQEIENKNLGSHDVLRRKDCRTGDGHFYDPHSTVKDIENMAFARELTKKINIQMLKNCCDSIILVAPPKMLGILRKQLNPHIHIDKSLPKEATHLDIQELEDTIFD